MTTPKPPGKPGKSGSPKPFLGDDDLSELDAWVETFDALHMGPEAGGAPAQPAVDATELVHVAADDSADSGDLELAPGDADAPLTLDIPIDGDGDLDHGLDRGIVREIDPVPAFDHRAPSVTTIDSYDDDPLETDFSGVGGIPGIAPEAPLLPRFQASAPPPLSVEDDLVDHDAFGSDDDDEVFTSASRPGTPAPDDALFDDDLAPPPAPEPRRRPAIVRRTIPPPGPREEPHPGDSDSMFSEDTRVADFTELERRVFSSRQSQPAAPPAIEEDDYADIEVSDDKAGAPNAPAPEVYSTSRRTAHVLRRSDTGNRPTQGRPTGAPPVVELDLDEDLSPVRAPSHPPSEDDFSDVAAAVGAKDDDDLVLPDIPRRPIASRADRTGPIPELSIEARPGASLDDAVSGLPTDEPQAFADPHELDEASAFDDPDAFDEPRPFDDPDAFDEPSAFDDPNQFDEPRAFADPNELAQPHGVDDHRAFENPNEFDESDEFRRPRLPPIERAIPPPERRIPRTTPPPLRRPEQAGGGETVRGISIAPPVDNPGAMRPPALTDLYPRVKTPTSVPSIGPKPTSTASSPPMRTMLEFVPQPTPVPLPAQPPRSTRLATPMPIDPDAPPELEPTLDVETVGRTWPEQVAPLATATLDEASAQALLVYEREIATVDDSAGSVALRIEAGRLCERLTDFERARGHYDAALMSDPRATPALRGLRRLARTSGDLAEAIRHLDAEISVAGALERRPLGHYRVDLMMASNEQDLARVAAGELLDQAPSDVRALLAQLELAFLDGRADEFGVALEQLARAVSDTTYLVSLYGPIAYLDSVRHRPAADWCAPRDCRRRLRREES
jgi:hypothetical protein